MQQTFYKQQKKNVLYLEDNRDRTIGGSYFSLLYLVKGLNKEKYKPMVFFRWENELIEEFKKAGCEVILRNDFSAVNLKTKYPSLFNKHRWQSKGIIIFQRIYNLFLWLLITFFKFPRLLWINRIDMVHINNSFKIDILWMIVPRILGVRCVCHQRGFIEPTVRITKFRRCVINYWLDRVVCVSRAIEEDCRKHRIYNTIVVYNGLDENDFVLKVKGSDIRAEFGFAKNDLPIVGIIGNIKEWKGQHVVVEAIAMLKSIFPRIRCMIIGEPPKKEKSNKYFQCLRDKVREHLLTKNVIFTGYRNDIPDLINGLDILIHASINPEPFGRVLLEGMALKKPVIATAHGGPLEIIQSGKSGILIPPGDPNALAEAIKRLSEDQKYAEKIAQAGCLRQATKFSSKKNVEETERLYQTFFN